MSLVSNYITIKSWDSQESRMLSWQLYALVCLHCTQSTDAGPRVILDDSRLQRWGTWRHRTAACPRALGVLSRCRQWLNANSQSPRLETLEFFPRHLPATGQLSLFSEYLGGKPQKRRVLKKRSETAVYCELTLQCQPPPAAQLSHHLPREPSHSLTESTLQESFLHTYNGK